MATLTRQAEESARDAIQRVLDAAHGLRSAIDGGDDVDDLRSDFDEVTGGLADLAEALDLDLEDSTGKHARVRA